MRNFRMRTRILNLPSCPDWRKVRVGSKVEEDEIPAEWEMEQSALDKLAYKRQASLDRLSQECVQLKKELEDADIVVLTTTTSELIAASRSFDDGMWPSATFRRSSGLPRQSQSLQNLSQHSKPMPKSILHQNERVQAQRLKKLKELRTELEEFAAVKKMVRKEEGLTSYGSLSLAQNFQGSHLSLINQDQMENGRQISEISYRIQKRREKELLRARREVQILEHKLLLNNDQN